MPTRTRTSWKPDSRGYYYRNIGWERSRSGKLQQHKFLLGTDRREAEKRERKLRELWDQYASKCSETRPLWPRDLFEIATQIAKGNPSFPVPRGQREKQCSYAARVQRLQAMYPVILFVPEDQRAFDVGVAALEMLESLPSPDVTISTPDAEVVEALAKAADSLKQAGAQVPIELLPYANDAVQPQESLIGIMAPRDAPPRNTKLETVQSASATRNAGLPNESPPRSLAHNAGTLHQALDAYQEYLKNEYFRPETEQVSPWGRTQMRQAINLQKHHQNVPLSQLDSDHVEELIGYWRRRPCRLGSTQPMTAKTAGNNLGTLTRFLKWLDRTNQFAWRKPFALNDVDRRVRRLASDHDRKGLEQVETFRLDELRLLMKYAQPFERLLLLLGINCGFGRAEIASLLVREVVLFQGHSEEHSEILGCATTDQDSFIKRIRRKSGVYGEHILFPMTVEGLQWAIERRKAFPEFGPDAKLILSESGTALDRQTKTGNANQIIPNHWSRLIKRIQDDGEEIRSLSFGKLRKTGSDLIRRFSDGEVARIFDCHGRPVERDELSDVYTNRPFGKVFQAIRFVQDYLAPMFDEAGSAPFCVQPQAYTKRSTIDRIIQLHLEGYPTGQIAKTVRLSGETVSRHIRSYNAE